MGPQRALAVSAVLLLSLAPVSRGMTTTETNAEVAVWWHEWLNAYHRGSVATAVGAKEGGPYIAPAFRADVVWNGFFPSTGVFLRDLERQRWRMVQRADVSLFGPGHVMRIDSVSSNVSSRFQLNQTVGLGPDASCKATPSPYMDTFAPLATGVHRGSSSVAGEPCELWTASFHSSTMSANVSACIGRDGVPRQFNQTSNLAFKAMRDQFMTFSNISVGPQPEEDFQPSEACASRWPSPPCEDGRVQQLMVYRSHSLQEPNDLENKNVGDALGDMAFFCAMHGGDSKEVTGVVTSWAVSANASWGEYAFCFFRGGKNECLGTSGKQVGRESAMGMGRGPVQGQCSENGDVGSWFSFPSQGHCPPGAEVGHEGCTWTARPVRTVSTRCILQERGLGAICAEERGHPPMLRSAAIFRAALQSADPAKGGCPDVEVAGGEEVLV